MSQPISPGVKALDHGAVPPAWPGRWSLWLSPARWAATAAAWLLAACASAPPPVPPVSLWVDSAFRPPAEVVDATAAMQASPAMRAWLARQPALKSREGDRDAALLRHLQRDGALRLEYDDQRTRSAAEAFEARAGNCLSLVMMTAALAEEMGLEVHFQQVDVDANWRRVGGLFVSALHVNLVLSPGFVGPAGLRPLGRQRSLVVDFLPPGEWQGGRARRISADTVLALYLNNRAAEFMVEGRDDEAYAAVRQALRLDASLALGYNTLGILYSRRHLAETATRAFEQALALAPDNLNVLANLATAWRRAGDVARADALDRQLLRLEPEPPYAHFDRAMLALQAGRLDEAREGLQRELRRAPDVAEFRYWLAVVLARQGDAPAARQQLQLALDNSVSQREQALYAAKLERLSGPH